MTAFLHGFQWKNMFAIDLFSVNKKIVVMNMEEMTWKNNYFENVVMAMTSHMQITLKMLLKKLVGF